MPEISIHGRSVFCGSGGVAWGDGRPRALLLHGAGQDHSVWALQARSLAQYGWNVVAPDLPGHGPSEDVPELDTIESLADWCVGLVSAVPVSVDAERTLAVIGHSMGACIALTLAALKPELVSCLALVGCGVRLPVNSGLLDDSLNRPQRAHRFITAFGHARGAHFGGAETPGLWNLGASLALLERCLPAVLHREFFACNQWRGDELVARVRCPTLVVAGDGDRMTPPKAGKALVDRLENARFELLPGTGHMMMAEAPSRVTRALLKFLDTARTDGTADSRS